MSTIHHLLHLSAAAPGRCYIFTLPPLCSMQHNKKDAAKVETKTKETGIRIHSSHRDAKDRHALKVKQVCTKQPAPQISTPAL